MKTCRRCGTQYPATNKYFAFNKQSADGLYYYCKPCKNRENVARLADRAEQARQLAAAAKERKESLTPPRTFNHLKNPECWTGHTERQYIRNEGLKHIPSRGFV